ncbi:MAG TPA: hypothetical protein VFQ24_07345 [Terriglobia bacterium]|nr:hypothetical protein [Terriglobia bacterium]
MRSAVWNVCASSGFLQHHALSEKKGRIHRKERDVCATRAIISNAAYYHKPGRAEMGRT